MKFFGNKFLATLTIIVLGLGFGTAQAGPFSTLCGNTLGTNVTVTGSVELITSNCTIDLGGNNLTLKGNRITVKNGGSYKDLKITGTGTINISEFNSLSARVLWLKPESHIIIKYSSFFTKSGAHNDLELMPQGGNWQLHIKYSGLTGGDDTELTANGKIFLLHNSISAKDDTRIIGGAIVYDHYNSYINFGTVDDDNNGSATSVVGNPLDELP